MLAFKDLGYSYIGILEKKMKKIIQQTCENFPPFPACGLWSCHTQAQDCCPRLDAFSSYFVFSLNMHPFPCKITPHRKISLHRCAQAALNTCGDHDKQVDKTISWESVLVTDMHRGALRARGSSSYAQAKKPPPTSYAEAPSERCC